MDRPLISVIMPVYNAEKTLSQTIDSILLQTFTDWELLCIDDGSTDSSGAMLDNYVEKDKRIHVFHKQNEGVSAARQDALDMAKGAYVIHADSDDWVDSTMLEELYNKAKENDADVVICDYFLNMREKQVYISQKPNSLESIQILRDLFQQLHGSCCNKLVKRVCYNKYDISFPKGINHCEDLLTWVQLFQHPEIKVSYLPKAFYHYCENELSITRNYTRKTYEMRLKFRNELKDILHITEATDIINKVSFEIFTEAFIYDVLSDVEIKEGLNFYKKPIKQLNSSKWKVGFLLLSFGLTKLAHKFIHY